MKIKDGYVVREVLDEYVIVPTGERTFELNGVISVDKVGMDIWNFLLEDITRDQLVQKMLDLYEVEKEELSKDIDEVIEKLKEAKVLENL